MSLRCKRVMLIMRVMRIEKTRPCERCNGTGERENAVYRGQEMRKLREASGMSLRRVAELMGLSAAYISDLELGRRDWSLKLITAYEKALR
jgi:predicted transcriptional regulator